MVMKGWFVMHKEEKRWDLRLCVEDCRPDDSSFGVFFERSWVVRKRDILRLQDCDLEDVC